MENNLMKLLELIGKHTECIKDITKLLDEYRLRVEMLIFSMEKSNNVMENYDKRLRKLEGEKND